MSKEFMDWWNDDVLDKSVNYPENTPIYWAWQGWVEGYKAGIQEGIKREHAMWQLAKIGQEIEHVHKTEKNEHD
jgi:hypothetical protein